MILLLLPLLLLRLTPFLLTTTCLILANLTSSLTSTSIALLLFNAMAIVIPPTSSLEIPFISWLLYSSYYSQFTYLDSFMARYSVGGYLENAMYVMDPVWILLEGFLTVFCIIGISHFIVNLNSQHDTIFHGMLAYPSLVLSLGAIVWSLIFGIHSQLGNDNALYAIIGVFTVISLLNMFVWQEAIVTDVGMLAVYVLYFNLELASFALKTQHKSITYTWSLFTKSPYEMFWNPAGGTLVYRVLLGLLFTVFFRILSPSSSRRRSATRNQFEGLDFNLKNLLSKHTFSIIWILVFTKYLSSPSQILASRNVDWWTDVYTWRIINTLWSMFLYTVIMLISDEEDSDVWQSSINKALDPADDE